ncbi:hypothetical protein BC940DRAFT_58237 [Gongronella butleri]|nr:hypothetical protein BC940DRAFT_58237 [Gongronella butleri]
MFCREPSSSQEHTVRPAPPPQKNSLSQSSFMTANSEFAQASSPEWPERQLTTTASTSLTPPDATFLSRPDATFLMPRPVSPALSVSSSIQSTSTSSPSSSSSSVATVRPPPTKPRRPLHSSLTRRLRKIKQYKQHVHRHHHRHHHDDLEDASTPPVPAVPLLWRKAGPVFTPHLPSSLRKDPGNPTTGVLKHDILLCAALMGFSREPSSYRAAQKMATRTDPWHQLEVLLTPNALDCYDSPGLIWPKRKRQYHVPLGDTSNPVTLALSSPLDYSFYVHFGTGKDSLTLLFLARSKTLCQEWYLAIYRALPDDCKAPLPLACDVYVPSLDLRLHIPLVFDSDTSSSSDTDDNHSHTTATRAIDARYYVTAEQVKTAVVDLLEEDDLIRGKDMALCWIRGDRAEWIHWQYDMKHDARADLIMGPQIIEHVKRDKHIGSFFFF